MSTVIGKVLAASQSNVYVGEKNVTSSTIEAVSMGSSWPVPCQLPETPSIIARPNRSTPAHYGESEAARLARIADMTPTHEELMEGASPPPAEWFKEV